MTPKCLKKLVSLLCGQTPLRDAMDSVLTKILDNALLLKLGDKALAIIHMRTARGEFLPGSTTDGYSQQDAPMPFAALADKIGKGKAARLLREIKIGSELSAFRNSKSGKLWIVLKGGYKRLRALAGREVDRVTLNYTGHMLRALKRKTDAQALSVMIYFTDAEAERIAGFHHQGAGRSKKKRLFMNLADTERQQIEQWLGGEIKNRLQFTLPQTLQGK